MVKGKNIKEVKIKVENRFATLSYEEYKTLVSKGKKVVVLYMK